MTLPDRYARVKSEIEKKGSVCVRTAVSIMERVWEKLQEKLPAEQVFYISTIVLLREFWKEQRGIQDADMFDQYHVQQDFMEADDYDFKEAVLRFCERMDWNTIEADPEILHIVCEAEWELRRRLGDRTVPAVRRMDELFGEIAALAEDSSVYVTTPDSVQLLLEKLLGGLRIHRMADICCGLSLLGVRIWESLRKAGNDVTYCGVELDAAFCEIARMLLFFHGDAGSRIVRTDILAEQREEASEKYDLVISDPPRGNNRSVPCGCRDVRLKNFGRKNIYTEWLFIQDILGRLEEGGYAAVLATPGALIRMNEAQLRKNAVERDWLEAVFTLPANLYSNTRVGTELLIFHKGKDEIRKNRILFVDISRFFFREKRNAYSITQEGMEKAVSAFQNYESLEGISVIADREELEEQSCSFKPLRYLHKKEETSEERTIKLAEVAQIIRGAQVRPEDIRRQEDREGFFINIKDIQQEKIVWETAERVNIAYFDAKEKFRIREDDILITSKGTAMKMAIADRLPQNAFASGNITIIRVDRSRYHPYILFEYLNSEKGRQALEGIQSGSTIRILNNANLREFDVPLYEMELMERIGMRLMRSRQEFERKIEEATKTYRSERKELQRLLEETGNGENIH